MLLSEDQEAIRDMARDFAKRRLVPRAVEWERQGAVDQDTLRIMGDLGFFGMLVPPAYGGAGVDLLTYVVALEEIAAGNGALSTVMSVNNSPVGAAILEYGTAEQKERFLKPMARGAMIGAFSLTEPGAGSDAANIKTRAVRDGNGWRITGTKQFVTAGSIAGVTLVFAVSDPAAGKRGMTCFTVPTDTPGYTVAKIEHKLGQRASDTCQIHLDVQIPDELRLGPEGAGYRIALANLETGRIAIGAQAVGMARAAFEAASAYAHEREAFGTAIINHQAVAFRLADMATRIEAARQLVWHATNLKMAGRPSMREASMAKLFASEIAERVASDAIQIHGGYGYLSDFPVERIYRDVRICQIYEGTSDIQRMVISRSLMGA